MLTYHDVDDIREWLANSRMKRPTAAAAKGAMEELSNLKHRHSMELSKVTTHSEELETLIPQKDADSKPAPAIHLNVNGEVDRSRQPALRNVLRCMTDAYRDTRVAGYSQLQNIPCIIVHDHCR